MHEPLFDPVLMSQARLGILSVLMTRREATFADLKSLLGLTQGNLGSHLQQLEKVGYAKITKEFVERKPRTTVELTDQGRHAFLDHVERLAKISEEANQDS